MQNTKEVCYNESKQTIFGEYGECRGYLHWIMEECSYTISSHLADKLDIADLRAAYDENAKLLLAEKEILSHVLAHAVREYQGMKPEDILSLIEDSLQVSQNLVLPGHGRDAEDSTDGAKQCKVDNHKGKYRENILPEITGDREENTVPGEGSITFDIKFHTWLSEMENSAKLLIDVEAQKNYYPGYDIVTRGVFYGSRMISAQYGTEFTNAEYDKLKKVYSIWVCMEVPAYAENTVTEYSLSQKNLAGNFPEGKNCYDLLSVIVIGLPKNPEKLIDRGLPRLLGILFSMELSVAEKKRILETEYHIPMTREINRRENIMCNLSEGIWERAMQQGIEQGIERGELQKTKIIIQNMLNRGMSVEDICALAGCNPDLAEEMRREMGK